MQNEVKSPPNGGQATDGGDEESQPRLNTGRGQSQAPAPQQSQQPKKKSNIVMIIVIVIVILLVLGVGVGYYLYSQAKNVVQDAIKSVPTNLSTPQGTTASPTSEGETLPSKDIKGGTDLEIVSRYPGSIMVEYSKDPDDSFTKITYQTKDSIDEIKEFYLDKMVALGWQMTSSEDVQIEFEKEQNSLAIWFYYHTSDQITDYELRYYPE